jgi:phage host-nuclease inhibitor protein Gam
MANNTDEMKKHTEASMRQITEAQTSMQNVLDTLAGDKDAEIAAEFDDAYAALRHALDSLAEAQDCVINPETGQ